MNTPLAPGFGKNHAPQATSDINALGFPLAGIAVGRPTPAVSIQDLWRIAVKHRAIILAGLTLGIALGIIASMLTEPRYRSTAVLEISQDSVQMINVGNQKPIPVTDRQFLETQFGLLKSRSLAERVARDLKLTENPEFSDQAAQPSARLDQAASALSQAYVVEPVDNSQLIRISYDNVNPQLAADVTNSFANNFISSVLERRYKANDYARNFLERRIAEVRGRLEDSERRLVGYAQHETIVSVGGNGGAGGDDQANQSLAAASLSAANGELALAQNARVAAEQRFLQAGHGSATNEVLQNAPLQTMNSRLAELRSTYEQKRTLLKPDHPEMLEIRSGIASLEADIAREQKTITSALGGEYRAAAARENELRGRVSGLTSSVLNLRGRMIQYNILQRDVDTNRQLYDALLQRFKEVGVSGGVGENQISVVDQAKRPPAPFVPDYQHNILIGAIVGLLGGVGSALGLGVLLNKVRNLEDIRERLGITPLGVIPLELEFKIEDALDNLRSSIAEAYASLRSEIQFAVAGAGMNSLLVTSSGPNEGKSTTALALAQNFARLGKTTLLVDADMRHPSFEADGASTAGLSALLMNQVGISEALFATNTPNLSLLPAGKVPLNPADLLADSRLPKLIKELESQFEVVIIDGPPVLGLADAPLLAAASERTLLVIETDRVGMSAARSATERLWAADARIIGAILTKFVATMAGYGYGYGYGYGLDHDAGGRTSKIILAAKDSLRPHQTVREEVAQPEVVLPPREGHFAIRIARVVFWISLMAVLALATYPTEVLPDYYSDKSQHIAAFAALTALALFSYPHTGLLRIGAALILFGGLIELIQMVPAIGRDGDLKDFVADIAAVMSILALTVAVRKVRGVQHRRPE